MRKDGMQMLDQTYNNKLIQALTGRTLRPDAMPKAHALGPMFSFWGSDAGLGAGDIHASRAYRIYVEYGEDLVIRDVRVVVDGELLSPCSGYTMEALDQFDFEPVLNWCLDRTDPGL